MAATGWLRECSAPLNPSANFSRWGVGGAFLTAQNSTKNAAFKPELDINNRNATTAEG